MNFIALHIGDWIKHTRGLPLVQQAIYMNLCLAYYTHERPFMDREEAYGEAGANTKPLREHTDRVLAKFFKVEDDGRITSSRCDEELQKFLDKQPEADARRRNEQERVKRHRERRHQMFAQLRSLGVHLPWDASTADLEGALRDAQVKRPAANDSQPADTAPDTALDTRTGDVSAACRTRVDTASNPQSPITSNSISVRASAVDPRAGGDARANLDTMAARAVQAMADAGVADVNPSDPVLQQALRDGLTTQELAAAAQEAAKRGKGAGWVLARAAGRRADAAAAQAPQKTVTSEPGSEGPGWRDPALLKIEADRAQAVPMPEAVRKLREQLRRGALSEDAP